MGRLSKEEPGFSKSVAKCWKANALSQIQDLIQLSQNSAWSQNNQFPGSALKHFVVLKEEILRDVKRELRELKKYSDTYFVFDFVRLLLSKR